MQDNLNKYLTEIEILHQQQLYRKPITYIPISATKVLKDNEEFLMMASNNYLGLTHHPQVKKAAIDAIEKYGTGSGGSRLISGSHILFAKLEQALAEFKSTEKALVFNTGYMANVGTISALTNNNDYIISDELNHASIIDGCRLSKAKTLIYCHKNMADLENILKIGKIIIEDKNNILIFIGEEKRRKELEKILKELVYNAIFPVLKDIMETSYLISKADLVITPDTSIVHIAAAFKRKLIAIYRLDNRVENEVNRYLWAPNYKEAVQIFSRDFEVKNGEEPDINKFDMKEIKKEIKKDLSIDTPLIAYDKYMSYIVYQSYNVKYDDKNTEKIINNVIDEALKERETSRGGTN